MLDDLFDLSALGELVDAMDLPILEAFADFLADIGILDGDSIDVDLTSTDFVIDVDVPSAFNGADEWAPAMPPSIELPNPFGPTSSYATESRDDYLARLSVSVGVDLPF